MTLKFAKSKMAAKTGVDISKSAKSFPKQLHCVSLIMRIQKKYTLTYLRSMVLKLYPITWKPINSCRVSGPIMPMGVRNFKTVRFGSKLFQNVRLEKTCTRSNSLQCLTCNVAMVTGQCKLCVTCINGKIMEITLIYLIP